MKTLKSSKKMILNGTENNGIRHRYNFDKIKSFKREFLLLMESLGFDRQKINDKFVVKEYIDTEEGETEKIWVKEVTDFIDVCWFFKNKEYEVDIFLE